MAIGSWIKVFTNKTSERGYDYLIDNKKASWSKGSLENIKEVFLSDGIVAGTLEIPNTSWHQFDRFSFRLNEDNHPTRKARFVQALIQEEHVGSYLCYNNNDIWIVWVSLKNKKNNSNIYIIQSSDVGKWITLKIANAQEPMIFLSEKGALNGKQLFK